MGAGELPAPTAQGDLATRPFAHLLLYVHGAKLEGTLVVWPAPGEGVKKGQDRILVRAGVPVSARLLEPASALDRGLLPLFPRESGPYAFYEADLVGRGDGVLEGRVDPLALLAASLRGAAREDAVQAVAERFAEVKVRFVPRVDLSRFALDAKELAVVDLLRAEPTTVEQLVQLTKDERRARRIFYLLAITKAIEPFLGRKQKVSYATERMLRSSHSGLKGARTSSKPKAAPAAPRRAPASDAAPAAEKRTAPDEDDFREVEPEIRSSSPAVPAASVKPSPPGASTPRAAAAAPRSKPSMPAASRPSPRSKPSMPAASRPSMPAGRKRRPSDEGPEPPPPPPEGLSPEHTARWREVTERAVKIDGQNYFEMLRIGRDAPSSAVRDAYFAQVKQWHPDRLPRELEPLRPWADQIFHHLTQARDTLGEDQSRGEYLRSVQAGGGTPAAERQVNAIVTAAMTFQKVEVLVRRQELVEALRLLKEARELNPEESDYYAMEAWILFQRHTGKDAPFDAMHRLLDKALELEERNARAHYYQGMVHKRQGNVRKALRHFERCAELDPKNIDAVREVRLASMRGQRRRSSRPAPPNDGGLLGKLFGGKKK